MVVSCFFCQSMLSDFLESLLPEARGQEIRDHLQSCAECSRVERELKKTVEVSRRLPFAPLNHETALRITEACHAGTRKPVLGRVARWTALGLLPLVFVGLAALAFPRAFAWLDRFRDPNSEARFVRYFPLLNGAEEIVDEAGEVVRDQKHKIIEGAQDAAIEAADQQREKAVEAAAEKITGSEEESTDAGADTSL